jgi:putative PIG3 family NAD(P)H quinone oxidoreductase
MKAIVITQFGGPAVLEVKELPAPRAIEDEVLIKVKASGLNRSDILQRMGHYPAPEGAPAEIPGLEAAGIIAACGPGVTMWKPGDKVCALLAGGAYAEYVRVKEGQCLPVPKGWTFTQAGGLPETVFTVWSNVFERGGLHPGETLLVHGGSSGIGITAIQIAHALLSKVIVTVGSDEKGKNCLQLGADNYINYQSHDFESILKDEGVDVILDMIGGDYFQKNLNILRQDGRLIHINVIGGDKVTLSLLQVMRKRLTISGSTLRSRDYEFKKRLARSVFENVWPIIEEGKFKPVIFQTFSYREAADAHRLLEQSVHTGKIILEWDD